jgi:hypothetical protein
LLFPAKAAAGATAPDYPLDWTPAFAGERGVPDGD